MLCYRAIEIEEQHIHFHFGAIAIASGGKAEYEKVDLEATSGSNVYRGVNVRLTNVLLSSHLSRDTHFLCTQQLLLSRECETSDSQTH